MKRTVLTLVSVLTVVFMLTVPVFGQGFPTARPEEVGLSSRRLDRINTVMKRYIDNKQITGMVTLVARHGKIAHYESFGMMDIEAGKPMTKDAMFRIASMSKAITSTAVMILYEEGRILLSDPVSKYIPEFKNPQVMVPSSTGNSYTLVPAKSEITIRNLLNHTSGITYGDGLQSDLYKKAGMTVGLTPTQGTIGEMIRKLAGLPLISNPGEEFHYGMSIDVLGYLVEVVSGKTFDEFLRERIFLPLNMNDTYLVLPKEKLPRLARLYSLNPKGGFTKDAVDPAYLCTQTYFSGGAGLVSTAPDYLRFAQMILNGGKLDGVRILSRKTVELMTTNSIGDLYSAFRPNSGDKFGYGFGIRSERGKYDELESLGIVGWDGAYYTRFWIDPEEDMIGIFMSQMGSYWDKTLVNTYRVLVYQAIDD
ncbi:beta-lactamase family protein [bacterium]|nr:beta-lactamase family protein [bacterium]